MRYKQFIFTGFLLLILGAAWALAQAKHLFTVQKIVCSVDQQGVCPDFLQAELQKNLGKSLFTTDFSSQLQRIATIMPSFHQASFQQRLPDTVVVRFASTQPQYAIKGSPDGGFFIVDETGTLVDQAAQTNLPVLLLPDSMFQGLSLRAQLPSQLHQAIETVFLSLQRHGLQTIAVSAISPTELTVTLPNQVVARLSTDQVSQELNKLAYILSSNNLATIKAPIKEIDLRFRYPVIKT